MHKHTLAKYEVRDVTWVEEREMLKECILVPLVNQGIDWQGISEEQAIAIRDRLISEILAEGFLEMPKVVFASNDKYIYELKAGDPLLIKWPFWFCLSFFLSRRLCLRSAVFVLSSVVSQEVGDL